MKRYHLVRYEMPRYFDDGITFTTIQSSDDIDTLKDTAKDYLNWDVCILEVNMISERKLVNPYKDK